MLLYLPPPEPVSFSRDIAPIMAMHCNICHGEAGGISTRSYSEIMLGGNLGKVIVPGNADASLLLHFIDGRRGEKQRMPKEGRPLSSVQMDLIRRWIGEGAHDDALSPAPYRKVVPSVPMRKDKITRVTCRVNAEAYLILRARHPEDNRVLWSEVATVKKHKDPSDTAEPGQLMSWELRAGDGWPNTVTIELSIPYSLSAPQATLHAELVALTVP